MFKIYDGGQTDILEFRPLDVFVTNWGTNPYFKGAYSVYPVKAFEKIPFNDLIAPLSSSPDGRTGNNKLYFAGEAFSSDFSAFVHGAFFSG